MSSSEARTSKHLRIVSQLPADLSELAVTPPPPYTHSIPGTYAAPPVSEAHEADDSQVIPIEIAPKLQPASAVPAPARLSQAEIDGEMAKAMAEMEAAKKRMEALQAMQSGGSPPAESMDVPIQRASHVRAMSMATPAIRGANSEFLKRIETQQKGPQGHGEVIKCDRCDGKHTRPIWETIIYPDNEQEQTQCQRMENKLVMVVWGAMLGLSCCCCGCCCMGSTCTKCEDGTIRESEKGRGHDRPRASTVPARNNGRDVHGDVEVAGTMATAFSFF